MVSTAMASAGTCFGWCLHSVYDMHSRAAQIGLRRGTRFPYGLVVPGIWPLLLGKVMFRFGVCGTFAGLVIISWLAVVMWLVGGRLRRPVSQCDNAFCFRFCSVVLSMVWLGSTAMMRTMSYVPETSLSTPLMVPALLLRLKSHYSSP